MKYKINFNAVKTLLRPNLKKRVVLTCIRYTKGKIQFTNSYSLVELNNLTHDKTLTLDVFTGSIATLHPYPDLERIKPDSSKLQTINNISITVNNDTTYYVINDRYFKKREVDTLFKTIGKKITDFENELQIHRDTPMIVVDVDGLYILSLGVILDE